MHIYFTPDALGPTWPLLLCAALFFAATTVFLFLTRRRNHYAAGEARFLARLYDATEMFGMLALFTGMLGTCLHLIAILPELNRVLHDSAAKLDANTATQLRTMWASAIAGLVLGGLWAETLRFFIKPRLRKHHCFIIKRRPAKSKPPEPNLDQAWQAKDSQGIY